jgi:hypothetical protein
MDLASLILACSVHADDALLLSVARVHSHGNPFVVINVNVGVLDGQDDPLAVMAAPSSLEAARLAAVRVQALGGEAVLGLLPVRSDWASDFEKVPEELFDPCSNIAVASAKISEFDYLCRSKGLRFDAASRRACTLDRYGHALDLPGLRRVVFVELLAPADLGQDVPELVSHDMPLAAPSPAGSGLFFSLSPATSTPPLQDGSDSQPQEALR